MQQNDRRCSEVHIWFDSNDCLKPCCNDCTAAQRMETVSGADNAHAALLDLLGFEMLSWALLEETECMHDQAADESEMLGLTAQPAASFQYRCNHGR
jgi:hypothetical protein